MAKKEPAQERKVVVTIRSFRKKTVSLDTWRYWEIVGELQFMGADRVSAVDAAKWCIRAKQGDFTKILLSESEEITLEVEEC